MEILEVHEAHANPSAFHDAHDGMHYEHVQQNPDVQWPDPLHDG